MYHLKYGVLYESAVNKSFLILRRSRYLDPAFSILLVSCPRFKIYDRMFPSPSYSIRLTGTIYHGSLFARRGTWVLPILWNSFGGTPGLYGYTFLYHTQTIHLSICFFLPCIFFPSSSVLSGGENPVKRKILAGRLISYARTNLQVPLEDEVKTLGRQLTKTWDRKQTKTWLLNRFGHLGAFLRGSWQK